MRSPGTAKELERRRRLAVARGKEGRSQLEVAQFLGVSPGTVSGWMKTYREHGSKGLAAKPHPGRPRRLNPEQERDVVSWFSRSPTEFGFPNELWTAGRVAQLIRRKFHIRFNPRYVSHWLAKRRVTQAIGERIASSHRSTRGGATQFGSRTPRRDRANLNHSQSEP